MKAGLLCRNCGEPVSSERVELGYDYCLKDECQQMCVQRVELAALGVNKAADYYVRADEVLPPRAPDTASFGDEEVPPVQPRSGHHRPAKSRPPKSALERLREQETALDRAIDDSYERFRRGEITAKEMDREQDRLVEVFNRQVMSENIRYRSFLRRRSNRVH